MIRALLYLRVMSLRNLLVARARRLRQPKYLVGFAVGAAYFWWFMLRPLFHSVRQRPARLPELVLPPDFDPLLLGAAALVFFIVLALSWIMPGRQRGLAFSDAEIAFLFPAPVSRRRLIHYKLVSSQFAILVTSLFFTLLSHRWHFLPGNTFTHAVGWWLILSVANLHFTAASLTVSRWFQPGASRPGRGSRLVAFALVAWLGASWFFNPVAPPPGRTDFASLSGYALHVLASGPLPWLLWPCRAVLHPFFAATPADFLRALPGAALVLVVHYAWIVRIESPLEEAALARAQRRSDRTAAREGPGAGRSRTFKARRPPYRLRAHGRPETAFLWKNLLATRPYFTPRVALATGAILAGVCLWLRAHPDYEPLRAMLATAALIFAGYTWLVGPQLARQDLRSDLGNADILKTYPLRGWQIVLGETLTPVAILTALIWLALLVIALCASAESWSWLTPAVRWTIALTIAALTPLLCALQLLIPNAATLVFPAWFHATRGSNRGIEVLGQRLIFVLGQLLTVLVALVPVLAIGLGAVFLTQWLIGLIPAVLAGAALMAAILATQISLALLWLGRRFERFDLSAELRP